MTGRAIPTRVRYRTIVVDPPWDHSDGTGWTAPYTSKQTTSYKTTPPYPQMCVDEIADLPVSDLAEGDAHLYLWTTNRYLADAFKVAHRWGFSPTVTLVWCKAPKGFMGGAYTISTEFCLYCRRGSLPAKTRVMGSWFSWPRGSHSTKPEQFLDMIETVSPGPYLELFARRQRLGWDTWGNEALEHVEVGA